jgi:hypothetical protein
MAKQIITSAGFFVGAEDLRCLTNQVNLNGEAEAIDVSTFCTGDGKEFAMGDKMIALGAAGFIDASNSSDGNLEGMWELEEQPMIVSPAVADGSHAFIGKISVGQLTRRYERGKVPTWDVSAQISGNGAGRGRLLRYAKGVTTGGNTAAVLMPAIASGKQAFAAVCLMALHAGGSFQVDIQSDSTSGFSSPTTQASFATQTDTGGLILPITTPVTDVYWRAVYSISGGTPSVNFAIAVGVT